MQVGFFNDKLCGTAPSVVDWIQNLRHAGSDNMKADYKLYKVNFDDLLFIEGQHEYVTFHTKTKRITALYSLKNLEDTLPKDRFIRVHKSFIVSIKNIEDIDKAVVTVAGNKIPIGASYRDAMIERLS